MLIWLQTPVLTHFIVCDRFPDVPEVFRDGFWSQKVERKVEQPIVLSKPVWTRNSTRNPPKCHSDWDWFVQCHRLGCSTVGRFYSLWYFVCISSKQTFNTTDRPRKRSRTSGSSIVSEQTINPISNQKWSWRCRKSSDQLQKLISCAVHMSWDHIQKLWRSLHGALRKVVHKIVTREWHFSSIVWLIRVPKVLGSVSAPMPTNVVERIFLGGNFVEFRIASFLLRIAINHHPPGALSFT